MLISNDSKESKFDWFHGAANGITFTLYAQPSHTDRETKVVTIIQNFCNAAVTKPPGRDLIVVEVKNMIRV